MNVLFPTSSSQKVANIWNSDHALADEGSFFVATSPTPLTAIATTASVVDDGSGATTHAQTRPTLYLNNGYSVSDTNAKSIYLKYLRLKCGTDATFTAATDWCFSFRVDNISSKRTSGGSAITPVNVNSGSSLLSKATIYFGAVVALAMDATTGRLLSCGQVQGTIPVAKDQWIFTFGDSAMPTNVLLASANKNLTVPCGPIIVAPGWNLTCDLWGTSNAGTPTYEFELGYVERVSGQ